MAKRIGATRDRDHLGNPVPCTEEWIGPLEKCDAAPRCTADRTFYPLDAFAIVGDQAFRLEHPISRATDVENVLLDLFERTGSQPQHFRSRWKLPQRSRQLRSRWRAYLAEILSEHHIGRKIAQENLIDLIEAFSAGESRRDRSVDLALIQLRNRKRRLADHWELESFRGVIAFVRATNNLFSGAECVGNLRCCGEEGDDSRHGRNLPRFRVLLTGLMRRISILSVVLFIAARADAQAASLEISPSAPAPGALVRLSLRALSTSDSVVRISGQISGEPLHFEKTGNDTWRAIGPITVDATGEVGASAVIERASGALDSVHATVTILRPKPPRPGARARALSVSPRFTRPLDSATQARIDRENATAREIGRRAHDTGPMWTAAFVRPRASTVTSTFGSGRMFNGTLTSRHLGVDFRGAVGDAVRAANRGVVALVDDFFLAGNVVYIDHGGGVVTSYFHLSKTLVSAGDTVERGQEIGQVGATGRVTGPHLHWSARYGAVTVNPLDLTIVTSR